MGRVIVLLILIAGLLWFLHWFRTRPAHQVAQTLRKAALWGAIAVLVIATLSGRLNPIFAAIAAMIPVAMRLLNMLRMLPMLQQLLQSLGIKVPGGIPGAGGAPGGGTGSRSSIRTRYLDMTLDHGSGAMDGTIREGPFAGGRLSDLNLEQLLRMLELYQDSDQQSAAVLTAYLDREHDDWRASAEAAGAAGGAGAGGGQAAARGMTRDDAWSILGLAPGADADAIRAAHRRLMQRLHPDRGGSDYLAAQINAAKDLLLGE
jgi:hypothetical protein